jgi:hypothetical protein
MNAPDVKHLDNLPNPNNEAWRPSQKTMADICFVCIYIQSKVQEHGLWTEEMSHQQLTECFDEVANVENGLLSANNRKPILSGVLPAVSLEELYVPMINRPTYN